MHDVRVSGARVFRTRCFLLIGVMNSVLKVTVSVVEYTVFPAGAAARV